MTIYTHTLPLYSTCLSSWLLEWDKVDAFDLECNKQPFSLTVFAMRMKTELLISI